MTARRPAPTASGPGWAPGVTVLALRGARRAELERISAERGLGFSVAELGRIQEYYRSEGRDPTDVELAGLAQSWSEHCSYKSSRPWLRSAFKDVRAPTRVLGTGDAGVLQFSNGWAYALRIESHNHPSAVEPYGGAATGIGGILRDVLAVGAKPIALADPLFFGPLDADPASLPRGIKSPRYIAQGVIAGIRDYGNRVGVPTVSGGIFFDPNYSVNPLVNVACVGFLPRSRLRPNRARAVGDRLVLVGGLTARDGIGGVAFASQELTERSEAESRGAVQLGDPIMKEPLIRACLEAYDDGLVEGVKDLGGGGLASASGEIVHAGGFGSRIDLDRVPLRESGLRPWEVWVSESQERMLLDVRPRNVERVRTLFAKHDVPATDIGSVAEGPYEELRWHGALAARLRVGFRVDPPALDRPARRRKTPKAATVFPEEPVAQLVEEFLACPDVVSREPVIRVYDHEVQGHTAVRALQGRPGSPSHGDATVLRPRPDNNRGLAVATAAHPWACQEDPRSGAIWVVEEAARSLYAVGARPDAFTNCLNFGNPEDPRVMGDFADVVEGLAEGAHGLGFAVPSGNVSFYNGGLGAAIPPTPVLLATGLIEETGHAQTSDLKEVGDALYLLGQTAPALGGSLWARRRGRRGLPTPPVDPRRLRQLGDRLVDAGAAGEVRAAHDVSDGGLAVALPEMAFGGGLGFDAELQATGLTHAGLAVVAEGGSRWVVEVPTSKTGAFERRFRGLPVARLGRVTAGGGHFAWKGDTIADLDLTRLYTTWRTGLGLP